MIQCIEAQIMVHEQPHRFAARKKEWLRQYKEDQMKKLDAQGRHRSQWCYAPYDGRKEKEIPHG